MTSRKIAPSGAGRKHAARGSLTFLPGGAGTEASPDWSEGEGWGIAAHPSPHPKVGSAAEGTEGSALESEQNVAGRDPTYVRMDKFAPIQVAREYELAPIEAYALTILVLQADWRSKAFVGTLTELAADLRTSRTSMLRAVNALEDRGLITVAEAFVRNRPGLVVINCYGRFDMSQPRTEYVTAASRPRHEAEAGSSDEQDFRDSSKELRNKGAIKEEGSESRDAVGRLRQAFPGAEEVS